MPTFPALKHVQGVSFPPLKKQSKMAAATCRFLWNWHLAVYIWYIIFSCMHFVCRIISSRQFPARIERRTRSSWIGPIMRHFVCIYASKGNVHFRSVSLTGQTALGTATQVWKHVGRTFWNQDGWQRGRRGEEGRPRATCQHENQRFDHWCGIRRAFFDVMIVLSFFGFRPFLFDSLLLRYRLCFSLLHPQNRAA